MTTFVSNITMVTYIPTIVMITVVPSVTIILFDFISDWRYFLSCTV